MNEKEFHEQRRAFIIVDGIGIILSELGIDISHKKMLEGLYIPDEKVKTFIKNCPRGYFKDDNLVLYRDDFLPITEKDKDIIRKYYEDLQKLFNISKETSIFSGLKKGKVGEIWQPLERILLYSG